MAAKSYADPVTTETYGSKDQLTSLNQQLADYIRNVRDMRVTSVRNLGASHYFETLEKMEGELHRIRSAYEKETDRLRQEVKDANTRCQSMADTIQHERGAMRSAVDRLREIGKEEELLRGDVSNLRALLAGRERDLMLAREELEAMSHMTNKLRHRQTGVETTRSNIEKRLQEETTRRFEAEENASQLMQKLAFQKEQQQQMEKEYHERLKASQGLVTMLDRKLGELSHMGYDQLPELMQKIRDMTAADMRAFHQQTEENLNKTITTLRRLMEEDEREKRASDHDKQTLKSVVGGLQQSNKDLQAQVFSLKQQVAGLKLDLENERASSAAQLAAQQQKYKQLQEELLTKAQEFARAREAQAALKAEIETYRELLEAETGQAVPRDPLPGNKAPMGKPTVPKQPPLPDYRLPRPTGQPQSKPAGMISGNPRYWGNMKDPSLGPYQALPPIGSQRTQMDGILDTSRSEPPTNKWSRFETTYKGSFEKDYPLMRQDQRNF